MIKFLTTPIFYLTPYIVLWSMLNGIIVAWLIRRLKFSISTKTQVAVALTTAIASMLWNWSIEFNQSTIYLDVDHPYLRVSWADMGNSICVFALTSFVLGMFVNKEDKAVAVARIAGIAALLTLFTDTFFF